MRGEPARGRCVEVTVPARLHLGLLDLEGGLGRRFGSLGLTLDAPCTRLVLTRHPAGAATAGGGGSGPEAAALTLGGAEAARAQRYFERAAAAFGLRGSYHLQIDEAIPAHQGLGSGTQLALAVGFAACRLGGSPASPREIGQALGRGRRSGIGIGAFEGGGLLLDGGLRVEAGPDAPPPPILCRLAFPDDWRVLLISAEKSGGGGLSGTDELEAFERLTPFPAETAARLCRLMLMAALPALAERDLAGFGAAVGELQRTTGDHFAPLQGGRFAHPKVAEVLAWLEAEGVAGLGQSSWGPTGFALLGSAAEAERLMAAARARWGADSGLGFEIRRGRNEGAVMRVQEASAAQPAPD